MKKLLILLLPLFIFGQNLSHISNARLAGQMIMIGFNGKNIKEYSIRKLGQEASLGKLGGVVFRVDNFENKEQAKKLIKRFKDIAIVNPLFLAIDYVGLDKYDDFSYCKYPDFLNERKNLNEAKLEYLKIALALKELGINLNLSLNLNTDIRDDKINKISLYARDYADSFRESGILVSAKAFPGDANTTVNSVSDYKLIYLKPFYDFVQTSKVDMIMVSNKKYSTFDKNHASMSSKIINILKKDLEYEGIIISDDILGGDLDDVDFKNRIIESINSGVDILYLGLSRIKYGDTASYVVDLISKAVDEGKITRERLEESYLKITRLKEKIL